MDANKTPPLTAEAFDAMLKKSELYRNLLAEIGVLKGEANALRAHCVILERHQESRPRA